MIRHLQSSLLLGALAAAWTTEASGKPISFAVDQELRNAWGVFEVRVLAVCRHNRIKVLVTGILDGIWRGHAQLGRNLVLSCWDGGRSTGPALLSARKGRTVLLVVDRARKIRLIATRLAGGYRFRGFYDFNACWLRTSQQGIWTGIRTSGGWSSPRLIVPFAVMKKAFAGEGGAMVLRAALLLSTRPEERSEERALRLAGRLGADSYARREKAHAELARLAVFHQGRLERLRKATADLEVRMRLARILRHLGVWKGALQLARRAASDPALERRLLESARSKLSGVHAARARARLLELERRLPQLRK